MIIWQCVWIYRLKDFICNLNKAESITELHVKYNDYIRNYFRHARTCLDKFAISYIIWACSMLGVYTDFAHQMKNETLSLQNNVTHTIL